MNQKVEYDLDKDGNILEKKVPNSKRVGKNPVFSNLQSQIERGEKSLLVPAVNSFESASWSTINLLKKTPASIIQESIKTPVVFSSENYSGTISKSQAQLPITKTQAKYAALFNKRFSSTSKKRKSILNSRDSQYQAVQIRKKYKNCTYCSK